MPSKTLDTDEEARCVHFLRLLGISHHEHRFLSDRGYFSLYLSGLHPDEVGEEVHPDEREFREVVRLLSLAGVEQIRVILERREKQRSERAGNLSLRTPLANFNTPVPGATPVPRASAILTPPPADCNLSSATPAPVATSPSSGTVKVSEVIPRNRVHYSKEIHAIKPTDAELQHNRQLQHPASEAEAIALSNDYILLGEFQDAYHVLVDYMISHPLTINIVKAINTVVHHADAFDREANKPPYNMLYECEELAALLVKRIPNLRLLKEADASMTEAYQIVKIAYRMWATHCRALLEFKYRVNNRDWVVRNWIDPRDFGFLVEIMRMAVRSMLPLDLLRFVYTEIKLCVDIGKRVIASEAKRCQFYAECMRIMASPARDVIPDLQFEIYREIIYCYLREGDSSNAMTFVRQALLIHKYDKEMLKLKMDLEKQK